MENENKTAPAKSPENSQHSKSKQRKHKSYFMTPSGTKDGSVEVQQAPVVNSKGNQSGAQGTQHTQNSQKNNNHHSKSKHRNRGNNNSAANNSEVRDAKAPETTAKNDPKPVVTSKNSRNRNKRKKHSEDAHREAQATASTPITNASPSQELERDLFSTSFNVKKSDKLEKSAPKKLEKFSNTEEYKKYTEYEEFSFDELYGDKPTKPVPEAKGSPNNTAETPEATDEPLVEVVGIRFKASGKTYYFAPNGISLKNGSHAIVETARGLEYGEVAIGNTSVKESETVPPLRPVIRAATPADTKHHLDNKEKEDEAFRVCNEKIIEHELEMKLIDAQYTFDNSKLLFYFTSAGRVDFRNLVKDLAGIFRTRIELRQIGIRDEAKMVGGLGLCGRPLCCSLFLTDFGQVSIKMAKEQNLSLNSSKISGICGRLMCCLRYEHETYEYEIKRTPPVDSLVRTVDGVGVVTEISPLAGTIKVRLNETPEVPPKAYKREEVTILKKKKEN